MRIKVLVAEDEAPILRSVCASITRANPNFEVVATATNGRKAMELIAQMPDIQVVFLDINMPMVNGIKLLEFLQAQYPHVLPVVLSGYQNFDYAQQSLKYGAKAYLLKPLRGDELEEVLNDLQATVIAENERYLAQMFRDMPTQTKIGFQQDKEVFLAAVFVGSFRIRRMDSLPSAAQVKTELAFRQFLDGAYGEGNYCLAADPRYAAKILTVDPNVATPFSSPWAILKGLFETMRTNVFEVPVTVVLLEQVVRFEEIAIRHLAMREHAWREMLFDKSSVLTFPEQMLQGQTLQEQAPQADDGQYAALFSCLAERTAREEALELYKNALCTKAATRTEVLLLTKSFFHAVFSMPVRERTYFQLEEDVLEIVENSCNKEVLVGKVAQLLELHWGEDALASMTKERLAQMIEQYLHNNIEQPITLETLEKRFGYTAAYLRDIFRAVYELSPQEYLLQLRIDRAKQMLSAGIAAKSVAQAVGFADPLYFSKVFKKQTGVTPSAYKQVDAQ